jgi:hypothetical protein
MRNEEEMEKQQTDAELAREWAKSYPFTLDEFDIARDLLLRLADQSEVLWRLCKEGRALMWDIQAHGEPCITNQRAFMNVIECVEEAIGNEQTV